MYQRGAPIATLMASLPYVIERLKKWDEEFIVPGNLLILWKELKV